MRRSITKFDHRIPLYRCPICHEALELVQASLQCVNRHTFNISAKGLVSLLRGENGNSNLYDRNFFEHRSAVFSAGMYEHVAEAYCDAVRTALSSSHKFSAQTSHEPQEQSSRVVDAGCGEGYYIRRLPSSEEQQHTSQTLSTNLIAIDLSKDAISLAAIGGGNIEWVVSDLARIPLIDHTVDCITNVFSPANYAEFDRILRPGGRLIKIIPGPHHAMELRHAIVKAGLRGDSQYSNQQVLSGIDEHMHIVSTTRVSATTAVDSALLKDFMAMTPVMFHINHDDLDLSTIDAITVEADVIVATR